MMTSYGKNVSAVVTVPSTVLLNNRTVKSDTPYSILVLLACHMSTKFENITMIVAMNEFVLSSFFLKQA